MRNQLALSFDESSGGRDMFASDPIELSGQLDQALSFDKITGGRKKYSLTSTKLDKSLLLQSDNPTDKAHILVVDNIAKVAKQQNRYTNQEMIHSVIAYVLTACSFFGVTDVSHIAYIFATMSTESRFGLLSPERTGVQLKLKYYEPVFITDAEGAMTRITRENKHTLQTLGANTLEALIGKDRKILDLSLLTKLQERMDNAFNAVNDTAIEHLRSQIYANPLEVIESVMVFPCGIEGYKHKGDERFKIWLGSLKNKLVHIDVAKLDDKNQKYYKLQFSLVILNFLLARIDKVSELGNTEKGDGEKFKGRGLVQITGRKKYGKFSELFGDPKSKYALALAQLDDEEDRVEISSTSFVEDSALVEDLKIGSVIAVGGMSEGLFSGRRLSDYGSGEHFNFFGAREIVNGHDRAKVVGQQAMEFRKAILANN